MKTALILYPNQLYEPHLLPKVDTVYLVEDPLFFGVDQELPLKLHRQKLVLHRASMQRYVKEVLWPTGCKVEYVNLDVFMKTADILEKVKNFEQVFIIDPVYDVLTKRLLLGRRENPNAPALEFLSNPNYYLNEVEARQYFNDNPKHTFAEFYQWQRERFNILIGDDYKPLGGAWSFEPETNERLVTVKTLPTFEVFGNNTYVHEAIKWVEEHFPNNTGSLDFIWPTNRAEAKVWLNDFVEHRLHDFGQHKDAFDGKSAWLYHSALSSSLNTGLLSPQDVIDAALFQHRRRSVPLISIETFVRQILGWREYMRGLYLHQGDTMRSSNPLKHSRRLNSAWYQGQVGLPPFDEMVQKVQLHAYAHNNERLAIAGNLMLLCEIHPDDIYRWFAEMFIDAYDWISVPNVFEMCHFDDNGNIFTTPFVFSSSYIIQMSSYQKGEWADIWDGLFWRFIDKHKETFSHNAHMKIMVHRLAQLDSDRKRIIGYRAEDFLAKFTH